MAADCVADAAFVAVRNATGCPSSSWQAVVADAVPRAAPVTMVNVGANKGYALVEFLGLWTQHGVSAKTWSRAIKWYANKTHSKWLASNACGFCGDCRQASPAKHSRSSGVAHALELAANNRALLREVAVETGLAAAIRVHNYAASNMTTSMLHVPIFAGGETRSLQTADDKICQKGGCTERVDVTTIDDFFRAQSIASVYHLTIDTEGYDALVLEGAAESLRARRVALLEFEVSKGGYWTTRKRPSLAHYRERRTLRATTRKLDAAGYACFWQTEAGLVPLSGPCWRPEFDMFRTWSNVVCAHEAPVVAVLVRLAKESLQRRRGRGE